MRTAALIGRSVRLLARKGSSGLVARSIVTNSHSRIIPPSNSFSTGPWYGEIRGSGSTVSQLRASSRVGSLRFMGFGSFKEEHEDAAVLIEKVEDEVGDGESRQVDEEAIEKASHELFRQSNVIGDPEEPLTEEVKGYHVKDHSAEKPHADIASEVWSAKEQDGTNPFLDDSDKVESKP